jgi:hypothetical protein
MPQRLSASTPQLPPKAHALCTGIKTPRTFATHHVKKGTKLDVVRQALRELPHRRRGPS